MVDLPKPDHRPIAARRLEPGKSLSLRASLHTPKERLESFIHAAQGVPLEFHRHFGKFWHPSPLLSQQGLLLVQRDRFAATFVCLDPLLKGAIVNAPTLDAIVF